MKKSCRNYKQYNQKSTFLDKTRLQPLHTKTDTSYQIISETKIEFIYYS